MRYRAWFVVGWALVAASRVADAQWLDSLAVSRVVDEGVSPRPVAASLAVFLDVAAEDDVAARLTREHERWLSSLSPSQIAGVWFVDAPAAAKDGGLERLAAALAGDADVRFVAPVYADRRGRSFTITRDVIVDLAGGVAGGRIAPLIAAQGVPTEGAPEGLEDGAYRARLLTRNGFEVESAVARLAASPEVAAVRANRVYQPTNPHVYIEPGPVDVAIAYADGQPIPVESHAAWRPMCGSDLTRVTAGDIRAIAKASRAAEAQRLAGRTGGPRLGRTSDEGGAAGDGGVASVVPKFDLQFTTSNLPTGAAAAISTTEAYLESQFADPFTAQIGLTFQVLGSGVLGATSSQFTSTNWTNSRNGLQNGMDADDTIQFSLPAGSTIPVRYDGNSSTVTNEGTVFWSRAAFRSTVGTVNGTAASMTFNSNFNWDYTPPSITGGFFCFQSVLVHEVGHALGFTSGADFRASDIEVLDVYRFQRSDGSGNFNPDTLSEFSTTPRMVDQNAPGTDDDVNSDLISVEWRMSDGSPNQASHFRDQNPAFGIMDPTLAPGQTFHPNFFRTSDLDMFDAVGYDLPAENTGCESARPIDCNDLLRFDNLEVSNSPSPAFSCGLGGAQDGTLWFSFVATASSASVQSCGSLQTDSTFAVYEGSCGSLTEIGCSEDGGCATPGQGSICVSGLTPGNTYYVQYSARTAGLRGSYLLSVACSCDGACCAAPPLGCVSLKESDCAQAGGVYGGPATTCAGDGNGNGVDDACDVLVEERSQLPTMNQEDVPSNIDWSDESPNSVLADDFESDGRPVEGVRWWGSQIDPEELPDGWSLSFHEPLSTGGSAVEALGVYYCLDSVVTKKSNNFPTCDPHDVVQYEVNLADCCRVHANVDSRTSNTPAEVLRFAAEDCLSYDLSVQAVIGAVFNPDGFGGCAEGSTGRSVDDNFWGWHSSTNEIGSRGGLESGLGMSPPDWLYGPWADAAPACGNPSFSFELLTTTPAGSLVVAVWGNGKPENRNAFNSQSGGEHSDYLTVDDFTLSASSTITSATWWAQEEVSFQWNGRVRVEIYPDTGSGAPDGSGGPTAALWVPTDGGAVTRTSDGVGLFDPRWRYEINGLSLNLAAGTWWIGLAPEGVPATTGETYWDSSHTTPFLTLFGGEAHFRAPSASLPNFVTWDSQLPGTAKYDAAFFLNHVEFADCNCNGVPDEEDIDLATSEDCNGNGIPDECERDCNSNGSPDDCDVTSLASADCQGNGVPDECDTLYGDEADSDQNQIPDQCECPVVAVGPEPSPVAKSRYISFVPGNAGTPVAIRVRLTSLAGFGAFNGQVRWVGAPLSYPEGNPGSFMGAALQCSPHFMDWGSVGTINVFGAAVLPNSLYDVQVIHQTCSALIGDESKYSAPLGVSTGEWADVVAPFNPSQPDFADVSAIVSKFVAAPTAVSKTRAQLQPNVVNPGVGVSFLDISACTSAFMGSPYPYSGPVACP